MPRWVNWRRVVLSSDPGSRTMPSLWLPGLAGLLACCCANASGMLSSHQHSVLHINSHQWRKAETCPWAAFSTCSHQHWCRDQSFTCIVESLAVNVSELREIGKAVVTKKKIKEIPLFQGQEVSVQWGVGPTFPMAFKHRVLWSVGVFALFPVKEIWSNYKHCYINIISKLNMSVCQ